MRALYPAIDFESCAALMLLELLFAGPRQGADVRAPDGDVPQADADSFDALLAGQTGRSVDRSAIRGKPDAGAKSADAAPQGTGTQTPLTSEPKQLTMAADDAVISSDSPSAPIITTDDTEPFNTDAVPMPESVEPVAAESFNADTPAPAPAPEMKPDTGETAVKSDNGAEAPAAPLAPQPTPPADADAETTDEIAARSELPAAKAAPTRNEASFNAVMAQVRAGMTAPAQNPASQGQAAQTQPAPSAPMPVTAEAAGEPDVSLEAAIHARKELLAARSGLTEGNETRLAAFARREIGAGRDELAGRTIFSDEGKPGETAKLELRNAGRPTLPQPALPAASSQPSAPQPFMNPAQFAQSGLAALLVGQTGQARQGFDVLTQSAGSDTGEIRLETGQQALPRTESAAAQAARAGTPLNMRLAAGQVPAIAQLIAKRFGDGGRSFDIRLDPAELGRVHVRLEIGADRSVQAMMMAEKPEALNELQRHVRELERALAEAGLDLGEAGIGFALFDGSQEQDHPAGGSPSPANDHDDEAVRLTLEPNRPDAAIERFGFTLAARGGVDVRI